MAHRSKATPLRDKLLPGLKDRHDGWTEARLVRFMDVLAETGCVTDAARVAGISTVGVARNRRRFPAFADAMDEALDQAQRGLIAVAHRYATQGKETIIIRKGEEVERRIAPDSATLGLLIKRGQNGAIRDPDTGQFLTNAEAADRGLTKEAISAKTITLAEWNDNWRFDADGKKFKGLPPKDGMDFMDRLTALRERSQEIARKGGLCMNCQQPLPLHDNRSPAMLIADGFIPLGKVFVPEERLYWDHLEGAAATSINPELAAISSPSPRTLRRSSGEP
jgi:hypothetical protein